MQCPTDWELPIHTKADQQFRLPLSRFISTGGRVQIRLGMAHWGHQSCKFIAGFQHRRPVWHSVGAPITFASVRGCIYGRSLP
jgi:hypothetical protein